MKMKLLKERLARIERARAIVQDVLRVVREEEERERQKAASNTANTDKSHVEA